MMRKLMLMKGYIKESWYFDIAVSQRTLPIKMRAIALKVASEMGEFVVLMWCLSMNSPTLLQRMGPKM